MSEKRVKAVERKKEDAKDTKQATVKRKETIDAKDEKITELTELLKRLQAEFENYRKRVDKDFEHCRRYAAQELVRRLLPIIDSFESALKNTSSKEQFVQGVRLIYSQLMGVLEAEGLRRIDCVNQQFDPYKHEVLLQESSDHDSIVLEELQRGYMLKDRVLRHSKVKVGKDGDNQEYRQRGDSEAGKGM